MEKSNISMLLWYATSTVRLIHISGKMKIDPQQLQTFWQGAPIWDHWIQQPKKGGRHRLSEVRGHQVSSRRQLRDRISHPVTSLVCIIIYSQGRTLCHSHDTTMILILRHGSSGADSLQMMTIKVFTLSSNSTSISKFQSFILSTSIILWALSFIDYLLTSNDPCAHVRVI